MAKIMSNEGMNQFIESIGRSELYNEIENGESNSYLKAVRVSLTELGYDREWVEGPFTQALDNYYLHSESEEAQVPVDGEAGFEGAEIVDVGQGPTTMSVEERDRFIDAIGRSELYSDIEASGGANYLKAVRVSLTELGYDQHWVEGEFTQALDNHYLYAGAEEEAETSAEETLGGTSKTDALFEKLGDIRTLYLEAPSEEQEKFNITTSVYGGTNEGVTKVNSSMAQHGVENSLNEVGKQIGIENLGTRDMRVGRLIEGGSPNGVTEGKALDDELREKFGALSSKQQDAVLQSLDKYADIMHQTKGKEYDVQMSDENITIVASEYTKHEGTKTLDYDMEWNKAFQASLRMTTDAYVRSDSNTRAQMNTFAHYFEGDTYAQGFGTITPLEIKSGLRLHQNAIGAEIGMPDLGDRMYRSARRGSKEELDKINQEIDAKMAGLSDDQQYALYKKMHTLESCVGDVKTGRLKATFATDGVHLDTSGIYDAEAIRKDPSLSEHTQEGYMPYATTKNRQRLAEAVAEAQADKSMAKDNLTALNASLKNPKVKGTLYSMRTGVPMAVAIPAAQMLDNYQQKAEKGKLFDLGSLFKNAKDKLLGRKDRPAQVSSVGLNHDMKMMATNDQSTAELRDAIRQDAANSPLYAGVALNATQKEAESQVSKWGSPKNIVNNMKNGFSKVGSWFKDGLKDIDERMTIDGIKLDGFKTHVLQSLPFYRESVVPSFNEDTGRRVDKVAESRRTEVSPGNNRRWNVFQEKAEVTSDFKANSTAEFMTEFMRGGVLYGEANKPEMHEFPNGTVMPVYGKQATDMNLIATANSPENQKADRFTFTNDDISNGVSKRFDAIGQQLGIENLGSRVSEAYVPLLKAGEPGYGGQLRKQAELYEEVESKFQALEPDKQLKLNYELADFVDPMDRVKRGDLSVDISLVGHGAVIKDNTRLAGGERYGDQIFETQTEAQTSVQVDKQTQSKTLSKEDAELLDSLNAEARSMETLVNTVMDADEKVAREENKTAATVVADLKTDQSVVVSEEQVVDDKNVTKVASTDGVGKEDVSPAPVTEAVHQSRAAKAAELEDRLVTTGADDKSTDFEVK